MKAVQACQTNTNDFQKRTNIDNKDEVILEARRQHELDTGVGWISLARVTVCS